MTEPIKASRATIQLGSLAVDGFMLPDGSYRMSQTQAAECVGKPEINARRFLESKTFKSLTGEGYTTAIFEIESETQARGQSRFRALPLEVVVIYWVYQCYRGNTASTLGRFPVLGSEKENVRRAAFDVRKIVKILFFVHPACDRKFEASDKMSLPNLRSQVLLRQFTETVVKLD